MNNTEVTPMEWKRLNRKVYRAVKRFEKMGILEVQDTGKRGRKKFAYRLNGPGATLYNLGKN